MLRVITRHVLGATLLITCVSANAQFFIFPIPLPNTEKPPQLKQVIDALEKSSDTKAVATISEDKTFGSKYWNWGYVSGEMSQEEADRIALASCTINLDQMKAQSAGGKPLYDFGKKKCELHVFKNKSVKLPSSGKIKISSSDPNYQKIQIIEKFKSFQVGGDWENSALSSEQKAAGTVFMAINNKLGTGFKVEVGAKSSTQDFRSFVESIRNGRRSSNTLDDFQLSQTSQATVNDRLSYQYTWAGKLRANRNFEYTYYDIVVDLGDALTLLTFWAPSNTFELNKIEFDQLGQLVVSHSTGESIKTFSTESLAQTEKSSIGSSEKKLRITINFGNEWVDENINGDLKKAGIIVFKTNHSLGASFLVNSVKTSLINPAQYLDTTRNLLESILKNVQKSDVEISEINGFEVARYETWGTQLVNGINLEMKYLSYLIVDKEDTFLMRFNTITHNYDFQKDFFEEKIKTISVPAPQKVFTSLKRGRSNLTMNQINQKCNALGFPDGSVEFLSCVKEIQIRER